jgi:putative redox protein
VKATATRSTEGSGYEVQIRQHRLVLDEPEDMGGTDQAPGPQELLAASLAACTAITMDMYARRKGWEIGPLSVSVEYTPADHGTPTRFVLDLLLPADTTEEQRERLRIIAGKCPVHRTLMGEVVFEDRVTIAEDQPPI